MIIVNSRVLKGGIAGLAEEEKIGGLPGMRRHVFSVALWTVKKFIHKPARTHTTQLITLVMKRMGHEKMVIVLGVVLLLFLALPAYTNIVDSTYGAGAGSFELGNFVNNGFDYMHLAPGDTTITGWTVGGPGDGVDWITTPGYGADTEICPVDLQHLQVVLSPQSFRLLPAMSMS